MGLLIQRRIPEKSVQPDNLFPPYDKLAREYLLGNTKPEDLVKVFGLNMFQACLYAVENINGQAAMEWLDLLQKTKYNYEAGVIMEKAATKLQRGEEIDWAKINYYVKLAQNNESSQFTPLSEVPVLDTPYIKTGYESIDAELWGIPKVGLIVVGAATGAGKTWFLSKIASTFVHVHPEKQVAFFTLEMMNEELAGRFATFKMPACEQERIRLNPHPNSVEEVIGRSAAIDNLGLIGVDFVDYLIKGDTDTSKMEAIYKTLAQGSKELGVPIIALAQLTGYNGGVPTPDMMRWSRMSQMLAWCAWTLYNPLKDWFSESDKAEETKKRRSLPIIPNAAFLCAWKMRGGFWREARPGDKIREGDTVRPAKKGDRILRDDDPIAIQIPYRPERGWDIRHKTFRLKE